MSVKLPNIPALPRSIDVSVQRAFGELRSYFNALGQDSANTGSAITDTSAQIKAAVDESVYDGLKSLNVSATIEELTKRLAEAEQRLEYKVSESALASILLTNEDILIKGDQVSILGQLNIADWVRNISGNPTGGVDATSMTRITGGKIQTGIIYSGNWDTTAGSAFNLDTGTLALGGSLSPKFSVTSAGVMTCVDAVVTGTLTAGSILTGSIEITDTGGKTLADLATSSGYSVDDLEADLAAGIADILAGSGGNYRLNVDTSAAAVIISHKDAVYNGVATAGSTKHALAITAAGIAMGYNRSSDGSWVNSVSIDASGNASYSGAINATSGNFVGTVSAGSIITNSVTVDGTALSVIASNASLGASAYSSLSNKLNKNAADVLGGSITFGATGNFKTGTVTWDGTSATGTGVMLTQNGIVGVSAGTPKFVLKTDGTATFSGDVSAGSVTSSSYVNVSGYIKATGSANTNGGMYSIYGGGLTSAYTQHGVCGDSYNAIGVVGRVGNGSSTSAVGVQGEAVTGSYGIGVYGWSAISNNNGIGVLAEGMSAGYALKCRTGKVDLGSGAISTTYTTMITNLNADKVDGYNANQFTQADATHTYKLNGGTLTGSATATFSGTKPGGSYTNVWLTLLIDGSTYYVPVWS